MRSKKTIFLRDNPSTIGLYKRGFLHGGEMDLSNLEANFQAALPSNVDNVSLRYVCEQTETLTVRKHIVQPLESKQDRGVMLTVHHNGGLGYAATSDMSIQWDPKCHWTSQIVG